MFGTKYDTAPKKYNTSKTTIYQESNTPSYTEDIEADLSYKGYEGIIRGIVESYENAALVDNYLRQAQKKEFEMKACCMNEDAIESFREASVGSATQIVVGSMQRFIAKIKGVMQNYNQQIRKYFDKKNIENFKRQVKNLDKEKCKEKTVDEYEAPRYPDKLLAPMDIESLSNIIIHYTDEVEGAKDTNVNTLDDGKSTTQAMSANNTNAKVEVLRVYPEVQKAKEEYDKAKKAYDDAKKAYDDEQDATKKAALQKPMNDAKKPMTDAEQAWKDAQAKATEDDEKASTKVTADNDADNTDIADEMVKVLLQPGLKLQSLSQQELDNAGLSDFGELYHKMCYNDEASNIKIDPDVMFKPLENGKTILSNFSQFEKLFDSVANDAIKRVKASKLSDNAEQIKKLNRTCSIMSNVCLQSTGILFKELQFGIHQANTVFNLAIGSAVSISLKGKANPQVNGNGTPAAPVPAGPAPAAAAAPVPAAAAPAPAAAVPSINITRPAARPHN